MKLDAYTAVEVIRSLVGAGNDTQLANKLGYTPGRISQLKQNQSLSPAVYSSLVSRAQVCAMKQAEEEIKKKTQVRIIVEYFPIEPKTQGNSVVPFVVDGRFQKGLKHELEKRKPGIYVFYDSKGCPIYVGLTEKNSLWEEMRQTLKRPDLGIGIDCVEYPESNVAYNPDQHRRIKKCNYHYMSFASMMSCYRVEGFLTKQVEALLIRVLSNVTINSRYERLPNLSPIE